MSIPDEQIREFEKITDYIKKLEWWKNQNLWPHFEAQSFPYQVPNLIHQGIYDWKIDKITVIPTTVEEVRILVDTYPNQFTEIEIRDLVVQKIETTTSIIEEFTWELKCGEDSKKNPYFITGLRYHSNQEKESRMLLSYIQDPKRIPTKVLLDFFSGLFVKRLHIETNEIEEIRNDLSIKQIGKTIPANKSQLQKCAAFFLAIYVIGRLRIVKEVKEFPFDGTSTNVTRDIVTMSAQWAMNEFGGKYNIGTLHSYLKTVNVKFANHIDIVEIFLLNYYPNEELKIKSEFTELRKKYRK